MIPCWSHNFVHQSEGLTLEVSVFQTFHDGDSILINSLGRTKFLCFAIPLMQHHSFFGNLNFVVVPLCFLAPNGFHVKAENDFLCIVVIALNMKISPCCLADYTPQKKKITTLAARLFFLIQQFIIH